MMRPFQGAVSLLVTVPGAGELSAAAVISEISASPGQYFPTAAQLASWTGICPGNHESAGRHHSGKRRPGNKHLQPVPVECAWAAVRHEGYPRSLYHRHVMRNGGYRSRAARNKAIITVARAILAIMWHVLSTGRPYEEPGPERETRRLIARLEALGHTVSLAA